MIDIEGKERVVIMCKDEIVREIERTSLFDFLANHGYLLSKNEIIDLFKEYNFFVYDDDKTVDKHATKLLIRWIKEEM